jgi:Arc/MetJ-type ribon-helix-helix transcriptional regulator
MDVTFSADLTLQVQREVASERYESQAMLIEQAVRYVLNERQRGELRLDSLRRIGRAVDDVGLYERTLVPDQE